MQNCKAACALMRLVLRLHRAFTATFSASKHETIAIMAVKSASVSSLACPRSSNAFCTGPHNCRNLASISTRLLNLVLQSKMRLGSLPNARFTYGWSVSLFFVRERLNILTTFRTLLIAMWEQCMSIIDSNTDKPGLTPSDRVFIKSHLIESRKGEWIVINELIYMCIKIGCCFLHHG